jgi:hypothetical protein
MVLHALVVISESLEILFEIAVVRTQCLELSAYGVEELNLGTQP